MRSNINFPPLLFLCPMGNLKMNEIKMMKILLQITIWFLKEPYWRWRGNWCKMEEKVRRFRWWFGVTLLRKISKNHGNLYLVEWIWKDSISKTFLLIEFNTIGFVKEFYDFEAFGVIKVMCETRLKMIELKFYFQSLLRDFLKSFL
jgi:hypothetical protein